MIRPLMLAVLLAVLGTSVVAPTVVAQKPSADQQTPDYWWYGSGGDSCGEWVQNKATVESGRSITDANIKSALRYTPEVEWVNGYVSGLGESLAVGPSHMGLAETDVAAIKGWMDKYCGEHPLDKVHDAATILVTELIKRK